MGEIGFLGIGSMGFPMAERLIDAEYSLVVYDLREDALNALEARGATKARSIKSLTERCETIVLSLPSLSAVRDVVLSPENFGSDRRLKVVINTSTVGASLAREMADALSGYGVQMVDCPISGGPAAARVGALSVMVSGAEEAIETVRPILSRWGERIVVAGNEPGAAQSLKLVNNILAAVAIVATSEAMVMGAKSGLSPTVMLDAINVGSGRNGATLSIFPSAVLTRQFDFGSPIEMLMKDVDLAVSQGESLGVPMWVCQAARLVIKHTQFSGRGKDDITTLIKTIEMGANFELPGIE